MEDVKLHFLEENGIEKLDFSAVGVTFDNKQEILQELFNESMANKNVKIPIVLIKQPQNKFDQNAIKICLKDKRCIGYVSKQFNTDIANLLMDIKQSYIKQVYMNNKRIYNAMIRLEF